MNPVLKMMAVTDDSVREMRWNDGEHMPGITDRRKVMMEHHPYEDMRFRDRRGREHYDDGRYAPMSRYYPPEYRDSDHKMDAHHMEPERHMNPIGFDHEKEAQGTIAFPEHQTHGMTRETAEHWVHNMKNEDGTKGPHWTMEQTEQVRRQKNLDCDPVEFWVAMNAAHSDLSKVAKKYNTNSVDFYVDYVKAFWFNDQDAVAHKLAAYYDAVVNK